VNPVVIWVPELRRLAHSETDSDIDAGTEEGDSEPSSDLGAGTEEAGTQ
jgi:hypothetical protein